jgi:hypothetical protein
MDSSGIDGSLLMMLSALTLPLFELLRSISLSFFPERKLPLRFRRENARLKDLPKAGLPVFTEEGRLLTGEGDWRSRRED